MQEAVSRLSGLQIVKVQLGFRESSGQIVPSPVVHLYAPLSVFAAASSIEDLAFSCSLHQPVHTRFPDASVNLARHCLKTLTKLQRLSLVNPTDSGPGMPHIADLLEGLPSTQMTALTLTGLAGTMPLMQQISRHRDLVFLDLNFNSVSMKFLDPLFKLRCLTELYLSVENGSCRDDHGDAASAIEAQALQLESAILDVAQRVGITARVEITGFK